MLCLARSEPVDSEPVDTPKSPAEPTPVTAANRRQTTNRETRDEDGRSPWVAFFALLVLIAALWGAHRIANRPHEVAGASLLTEAVAQAGAFQPALATEDPDHATTFLLDRFGWPVDPPRFQRLTQTGVGSVTLAPGAEVPAFLFRTDDGARVVIFAYDYVFLDEVQGTLDIPAPVYARLANPPTVDARRLGDSHVITWRRRAVIYSAVTTSEAVAEGLAAAVQDDAAR